MWETLAVIKRCCGVRGWLKHWCRCLKCCLESDWPVTTAVVKARPPSPDRLYTLHCSAAVELSIISQIKDQHSCINCMLVTLTVTVNVWMNYKFSWVSCSQGRMGGRVSGFALPSAQRKPNHKLLLNKWCRSLVMFTVCLFCCSGIILSVRQHQRK